MGDISQSKLAFDEAFSHVLAAHEIACGWLSEIGPLLDHCCAHCELTADSDAIARLKDLKETLADASVSVHRVLVAQEQLSERDT